jgi:hypothetical protein
MPAVACAQPHRFPVAGLVAGALISLQVGKTLGQQRLITKVSLPLLGQGSQRGAHGLRGQIGRLSFVCEHQKAAVLNDQLETLQPLVGAPADPPVAILQRVASRSPDQQRHRPALHLDDLSQVIAHSAASAQIMMLAQQWIEPGHLILTRHPDHQSRTMSQSRHYLTRRLSFHRAYESKKAVNLNNFTP